jgi:hypothetical protein
MPKPRALLSYINEPENTKIEHKLKTDVKKALLDVAKQKNAWIISGGLDFINDDNVEDVMLLKISSCMSDTNSTNTYNLFIDDCKSDEIDEEFSFRNTFEECIKNISKIPRILVTVGGGIDTIIAIFNAIKESSFVVLISVSILLFIFKTMVG